MGLVAAIVLGILMGKFLAVWILILVSLVLVILILKVLYMKVPKLGYGPEASAKASGKIGVILIVVYILIGILLFLISIWVTYFFTSDQTALIEAVQSIEFLRK
jgi:hypothetical protein